METINDDRIIIMKSLKNISDYSIMVKNYVILWCVKGKATLYINGNNYLLLPNALLICHPKILLEHSMASGDFEFRCVGVVPEYINQLSVIAGYNWNVKLGIEKKPVVYLTPDDVNILNSHYEFLLMKLQETGKHHKESIDSFAQSFLFVIYDVLEKFVTEVNVPKFTSAESLFKEFVDLVEVMHSQERKIGFYADKLNVSSKYLSSVCKEVSGVSAYAFINQYVVKDIQYLLTETRKSIKEISTELNFDNLSFFGKYVKRFLGVSPKEYREKYFNVNSIQE